MAETMFAGLAPEKTKAVPVTRAEIERIRTQGASRYRVAVGGEVLIEASRDPEFAACRALQATGVGGILETWVRGAAAPGFRIEIAKGAKLAAVEGRVTRPRVVPWSPYERGDDDDGDG